MCSVGRYFSSAIKNRFWKRLVTDINIIDQNLIVQMPTEKHVMGRSAKIKELPHTVCNKSSLCLQTKCRMKIQQSKERRDRHACSTRAWFSYIFTIYNQDTLIPRRLSFSLTKYATKTFVFSLRKLRQRRKQRKWIYVRNFGACLYLKVKIK